MKCAICDRKFNSNSSFYRHSWSDKHNLTQQIKEYEKEIKELMEIISQNQKRLNELLGPSQYHSISEKSPIVPQDLFA